MNERDEKRETLQKAHESCLRALREEYGDALRCHLGDRLDNEIRAWYAEERERFETPEGKPARVLDFVPILTRRAVEARIRAVLKGRPPAYQGAA